MGKKIVRVVKGKIDFDEFDGTVLNPMWEPFPLDTARFNLTEEYGAIKLICGMTDFMLLRDETDAYVFDVYNAYIPSNSFDFGGIIIFRDLTKYIEFIEFRDDYKPMTSVYKYMRVKKVGTIYMFYAKNTEGERWELISSVNFTGAGKIGLIIKGAGELAQEDYIVDYVRMYRNQEIRLINIPPGYVVQLYTEYDMLFGTYIVQSQQQGARFMIDDVPPYKFYFRVFTPDYQPISTSPIFQDMCGGDIYYYGAMPEVLYNGINLLNDNEFFLGYFKNSVIEFQLIILNPWEEPFTNVYMKALRYKDYIGYEFVEFSLDAVDYFEELSLGTLLPNQQTTIFVKITRDLEVPPNDIEPFKFNVQVRFDD